MTIQPAGAPLLQGPHQSPQSPRFVHLPQAIFRRHPSKKSSEHSVGQVLFPPSQGNLKTRPPLGLYTACGHGMAHGKWKETKQQPSQLCLAAALFLSISCGPSYVRRLYIQPPWSTGA